MNYTTGEQEMLGIVKALKEWRCYLEGCRQLTIVTDHNPLTYFPTQTVLSRRQARWQEFLSRFTFTVRHRPGAGNPADALSRAHESTCSLLLAVTMAEVEPENKRPAGLLQPLEVPDTRWYTVTMDFITDLP